MAVLNDADRIAVWTAVMNAMSQSRESCPINKTQLRAAVDAADQWADDNAASFNSALPVAARNNLTQRQKARLLMLAVAKRFEVS